VTLLNNMHDLDEKRTKTLEKCFESVKINLSKIFNDLLPGATAHITLIDERDVTKGAELSVHFNSIKKELS
jgi:structural maintenance of chromosome 2